MEGHAAGLPECFRRRRGRRRGEEGREQVRGEERGEGEKVRLTILIICLLALSSSDSACTSIQDLLVCDFARWSISRVKSAVSGIELFLMRTSRPGLCPPLCLRTREGLEHQPTLETGYLSD